MARLFIAFHIPPPDAMRKTLRAIAQIGGRVRAVHPDQLHLTLRFLGEMDPAQVDALHAALQDTADHSQAMPIEVRWQGLGQFPPPRPDGSAPSPRVLFARPDDVAALQLSTLADLLTTHLESRLPQMPREERPYHAHLTLARIKPPRRGKRRGRSPRHAPPTASPADPLQPVRDLLNASASAELGSSSLDQLDLIESRLTPDGPVYTIRATVPLAG